MKAWLAILLVLAGLLPAGAQGPVPMPSPTGPVMPDVRGLTREQARLRLREAGITRYEWAEAQARQHLDRVVRQAPLPGAVLGPHSTRPVLSLGVLPEAPRTPQKPQAAAPPRPPIRWWAWALMILGTGGMAWLAREAVHRWEPPPPPETPSIEVTRVTRPAGRPKRRR